MKKYFYFAALLLACFSCGTDLSSPRQKAVEEIKRFEAEMHKSPEVKKTLADSTLLAYEKFVEDFPADSLSPDLLFKGAEIATAVQEYDRALGYYKRIVKYYPKYKLFPESLFLQGSLLDNYLDHDGEAKMVYDQIIEKYPQSAYADDARAAIRNLGKSDEELLKEFKEKNK
jgi:outer membrane protein assembly factor BamD (BamD/ComL family)